MESSYISKVFRFLFAVPLCLVALFLPYGLRMRYTHLFAFLFHLPFVLFGRITRYLFRKLGIDPHDIDWT